MRTNYTLDELCMMWNSASSPYVLRTEHEHKRQRQLARAIDNRMIRLGYKYGIHWKEWSTGSRTPIIQREPEVAFTISIRGKTVSTKVSEELAVAMVMALMERGYPLIHHPTN